MKAQIIQEKDNNKDINSVLNRHFLNLVFTYGETTVINMLKEHGFVLNNYTKSVKVLELEAK